MTAEQIRDSLLLVSGALDTKMGGPSADADAGVHRRTRLRQGQPLQARRIPAAVRLPEPESAAEKRFTTTVPLQRLFLMNSDFMQQQGELLARRIADEPDNAGAHPEGLSPDLRPRAERRRKCRPASSI